MTKKKIGEKVKSARQRKKISYYAIDKLCGVKPNVMQNIENGNGYTIDSLQSVLTVLNLRIRI